MAPARPKTTTSARYRRPDSTAMKWPRVPAIGGGTRPPRQGSPRQGSRRPPPLPHPARSALGGPENRPDRAVIAHVRGAEAPYDVVVELRAIDRRLALVGVAQAQAATALAAAVVVGDDVIFVVGRVQAGADPGGVGDRRAGRTLADAAAAAGAQEPVESAIAPVVALRRVAGVRRRL